MVPFLYWLVVQLPAHHEQQELLRIIARLRDGLPHHGLIAAFAADVPMLLTTWRRGVERLERCVEHVKPADKTFEGAHRLSLAAQVVSQLAALLVRAADTPALVGAESMKTSPAPFVAAVRLGHQLRRQSFAGTDPQYLAISRECGFVALDAVASLEQAFGEAYAIECVEAGVLEAAAILSLARVETDSALIDRQTGFTTDAPEAQHELGAMLGPLTGLLSAQMDIVQLAAAYPRYAQIVRERLAHLFVTVLAGVVTTEEPKLPRSVIRGIVRDHWLDLASALGLPSIPGPAYCWSPACARHRPDSPDGPLDRCSGCKLASCTSRPRSGLADRSQTVQQSVSAPCVALSSADLTSSQNWSAHRVWCPVIAANASL